MKHNRQLRSLLLVLATVMVFGALYAYPKSDTRDKDADSRKAAYIYMQALDAFMEERYNLYGELLTRAYELDPQDPELTSRFGEWLLLTNSTDSAAVERGFSMMLDGYNRQPTDYFEGLQLLNLTTNYRRWDDNLAVSKQLSRQFPDRNEVSLQLGRSYLMHALMGDTSCIAPAIKVFDDLENKLGKSSPLTELKVRAYAIGKDTAKIIRELGDLYAASPADPYTALSIGQIYNSLSEPDSALVYYNRACELDSTNGNAILLRARLYQQQGDSLTFNREAFKAIKSQDLELDTKLRLIVNYVNMLYNDSTQHQRIDNLFETLLDVNPGEAEVHRLYAEYLAQIGKMDRAADQMSYVVSLDGTEKSNWLFLAQLYSNIKDYAGAARTLDKTAGFFPEDYVVVSARSAFHSLSGDTIGALKILEEYPDSLITDADEKSDYMSSIGDLSYQLKDFQRAFNAYEAALKSNPFNYMAMNNIAYYFAEADTLLDKAETYAARAVRHEPDNPTFLDTYAWVLYRKGDYSKAKEQIDLTLELLKFDAAIDSVDNAIDSVGKDLNIAETPDDKANEEEFEPVETDEQMISSEIYDHAGDIYYRCGDVYKAVDFWKKALEAGPDDPKILEKKIKNRKIIDDDP